MRLQTSLPFRGHWPWGTSDRGMRTKACKPERLLSSSRAPFIQYSRSGEARAEAHKGSSLSSRVVSVSPLEMAESTSGMEKEGEAGTMKTGIK